MISFCINVYIVLAFVPFRKYDLIAGVEFETQSWKLLAIATFFQKQSQRYIETSALVTISHSIMFFWKVAVNRYISFPRK